MARLRYNGLSAELGGAGLTNFGTTITFTAGLTHSGGTNVPTIAGSDYIPLSIMDANGRLSEIVYLTAYTAAATTGTISRGEEGTTGVSHSVGVDVVNAPTPIEDVRGPAIVKERTAGDLLISSTTFVALDTALDITIPAYEGDQIQVGVNLRSTAVNAYLQFDLGSIVSGSLVNRWGGGLTDGIPGWGFNSNSDVGLSASEFWPVVAGDLSAGSVTLRYYVKRSTANRTIIAQAIAPLRVWARNLGQ